MSKNSGNKYGMSEVEWVILFIAVGFCLFSFGWVIYDFVVDTIAIF